jgi:hypothetical protein
MRNRLLALIALFPILSLSVLAQTPKVERIDIVEYGII